MRRLSRVGLAGLPGVALNKRDRRRLATHLSSSSSLSGVGVGVGGASGGCSTCAPASLDAGLAAQVAQTLGAPDLAKAVLSGEQSEMMKEAGLLAAATFDAMKLRKDRFAVLEGITSPVFAQLAGRSARGMGGKDESLVGVLVLMYLSGAIDDRTGRRSEMAAAYRKASSDLRKAMAAAGGAGRGLGAMDLPGLPAIAETSSWLSPVGSEPVPAGRGYQTFRSSDPKAFWPAARRVNVADLGTLTRSPDAVEMAPVGHVAFLLWSVLIEPVQKAGGAAAAVAGARKAALEWERLDPKGDALAAAKRVAAWIIRFYGDKVTTWGNSSAGIPWGEFPGMPFGTFGGTSPSWKNVVNLGLRREDGWTGWLSSHWRRFVSLGTDEAELAAIATGANTVFPMRVAALLRLASQQAWGRTGQTGAYDSIGLWRPSASGAVQVPSGDGSVYATRASMPALPFGDPELWQHVEFVGEVYRRVYRKEPTPHALFWYGSFGKPVGDEYANRVAALESIRMSGSVPPPQDQADQTNWFAVLFGSVGPTMAASLDWVNKGVKFASDSLCYTFKTFAGPDIGGVLCSIFDALLKLIGGIVKGSTAVLASVGKALLGLFGKLQQNDPMGAAQAFFVGVNQAVFFAIGSPYADMIGVPFLKTDEKPQSDAEYLPSMERMAEDLAKRDPLFVLTVTISIITVIATGGTPVAVGALVVALAPVFGLILVGPVRKGLAAAREPEWLSTYKTLPAESIQRAVESLVRLSAAVIVGVMTAQDAAAKVGRQYNAFVKKKGVSGATYQSIQFFLRNFSGKLVGFSVYVYAAASNPKGFSLETMINKCLDLLGQFLVLIPVFAEQAGFDKEGLEAAKQIADLSTAGVAEAKAAFKAIFAELSPADQQSMLLDLAMDAPKAPAAQAVRQTAGATAGVERGPILALLGVAAGLTVGFMAFSGGRRGA